MWGVRNCFPLALWLQFFSDTGKQPPRGRGTAVICAAGVLGPGQGHPLSGSRLPICEMSALRRQRVPQLLEPFSEVGRRAREGRELAGDPEGEPQQSSVGGRAVRRRPFAAGRWGGAPDHGEGALCGGALTPSGSHALALPGTCLRAPARRGAPAAAAGGLQTVSRQCGGVSRGPGWRSPQRSPFLGGAYWWEGRAQLRELKGGAAGGRETPSIPPPTPSPESAPNPHTPVRRGLRLLQFGAQRSPPPGEGEDLRTS